MSLGSTNKVLGPSSVTSTPESSDISATLVNRNPSQSRSRDGLQAPLENNFVAVVPQNQVKQDVKESFADTKQFVRKVGDVLSQINNEFSVSGGIASTFKDAVLDHNNNVDLSRSVRSTIEYSESIQKGIDSLAEDGIKGINNLAESAFKTLDETFTPMKTLSDSVGEFSKAMKSGTKGDVAIAALGVVGGGIQSLFSALTKYACKLTVGLTAFAASSVVAVGGIAAKAVTAVVTPVIGAVEAVTRTVVAPVVRGALELTGKLAFGATAFVGGVIGTLGNAVNVSNWMGKVGSAVKGSSLGQWISEKTSTKSDVKMNQIDAMMSEVGISSDSVKERASSNKSEKLKAQGYENGELGIKGTVKKWYQTALGKRDTQILSLSGSLTAGKFASELANGGMSLNDAFNTVGTAGQAAMVIGVVSGPLTVVGSGYKTYTAYKDHEEASTIKDNTVKFIDSANTKINELQLRVKTLGEQNRPENKPEIDKLNDQIDELSNLKRVAELEGNRAGLNIKKLAVAQNGIVAVSGAFASTAAIAAFVGAGAIVAATGPVGLGLAGAGAVIGVGVATYKIYKAEKREARNDKLEAQQQLVEEKMRSLDPNSDSFKKLSAIKTKIENFRMQKDPKFASEYIDSKLKSGSPNAQAFVKDIFGDKAKDILSSPNKAQAIQDKMPIVSGDQRIFWREPDPVLV